MNLHLGQSFLHVAPKSKFSISTTNVVNTHVLVATSIWLRKISTDGLVAFKYTLTLRAVDRG